jgi:hypothetical protein
MPVRYFTAVAMAVVLASISACSHNSTSADNSQGSTSRRADAATATSSENSRSTQGSSDPTPDCTATGTSTRDPRCPPSNPGAETAPPADATDAPTPR